MPARKALYAILLCAFSAAAHAARIGEWTVFPAYKDATRNVVAGEWVYSLSSSNLYRYHAATGEVQLFSRQNGLNDAGISHIDYCRAVMADGVRTLPEMLAWHAAHRTDGIVEWMP